MNNLNKAFNPSIRWITLKMAQTFPMKRMILLSHTSFYRVFTSVFTHHRRIKDQKVAGSNPSPGPFWVSPTPSHGPKHAGELKKDCFSLYVTLWWTCDLRLTCSVPRWHGAQEWTNTIQIKLHNMDGWINGQLIVTCFPIWPLTQTVQSYLWLFELRLKGNSGTQKEGKCFLP